MEKTYSRIDWENKPSTKTAVNEANLNRMDSAIDVIDNRVISLDLTKAKQSDMLESVKSIEYNETTGLFVFTWHNGTSKEVDLNIEKIPVSFSMSSDGIITMVTSDGTEYTADIGSLITNYDFEDTPVITFSKRTAQDGTEVISANIPDGSITGNKLQPNYLADVTVQAANALRSETNAGLSEIKAKGSEDRAKHYADQAEATDVGQLIPRVAALETGKADETEVSAITESLIQFKDDGFLPKNLFDADSSIIGKAWNYDSNSARAINLVEIKPNTKYTVSFSALGDVGLYIGEKANKTDTTNTKVMTPYTSTSTFTTQNTSGFLVIQFNKTGISKADIESIKLQIEEGEVAHAYTPYAKPNTELTQIVKDAEDRGFISKNIWSQNPIVIGASSGVSYNQPLKKGRYIIKADSNISASGVFNLYGYVSSLETLLSNISWADAKNGIEFETTKDYDLMRIYSSGAVNGNIMICNADFKDAPYQPYAPSNLELKQSLSQLSTVESADVIIQATTASVSRKKVKKCGNIVTVNLNCSLSATVANRTVFATLPSGYRPSEEQGIFIRIGNNIRYGGIATDGTIQSFTGDLEASTLAISTTFII